MLESLKCQPAIQDFVYGERVHFAWHSIWDMQVIKTLYP
jgi:hypothetical protein